jgi:flavodoxin
MKIGIIVYSKTNNTMSVVQLIEQKSIENGHTVEIIPLILKPNGQRLDSFPNITGFDYLVFATPVHAFQASLPMKMFLQKLPNLEGVKFSVLITMSFKKAFLGGNRAVNYIKKRTLSKGAIFENSSIIHWSSPLRSKQIIVAVDVITPQ